MSRPLSIPAAALRYRAMIGVGGIGAGSFFAVSGNRTIGREESREGRFLDQRDYCKLHIIAHYVQTLLGPAFKTLPVGRVGDDETGRRLAAEMAAAGMDMRYVAAVPGEQTLFSFCFVYPDGSGGNLTTGDSACAHVSPAAVAEVEPEFRRYGDSGIALAVPEVPLGARAALLEYGTAHGYLRAASFTAEEMAPAMEAGLLRHVDWLAINRSEAGVAAGLAPGAAVEEIVAAAVQRLRRENPTLRVAITAGAEGSWVADGAAVYHQPAWPARARSTAGAGDAHFAGLLAGLAAGLETAEAHQLAALVASLSVESPHTIHPGVDRDALREFTARQGAGLSPRVAALIEDGVSPPAP